MSDEPDELELLRRANPVPTVDAADDDLAMLVTRIERTTMESKKRSRTFGGQRAVVIGAAAAVAVLAAVGVLVARSGDGGARIADSTSTTTTSTTAAGEPSSPGGRISPGGAARCVEQYDAATLTHREYALDGAVQSVDGDSVTFVVNEWFHGGDAGTITLKGASTIGGTTSAGDAIDLTPGSHLLVSGDGGFAWSCGFTQPFDAAVADQWRSTLAG